MFIRHLVQNMTLMEVQTVDLAKLIAENQRAYFTIAEARHKEVVSLLRSPETAPPFTSESKPDVGDDVSPMPEA
jgi:hypothetical protein